MDRKATVWAFSGVLLLGACAGNAAGPCGESFCLPAEAVIERRDASAEDFNLYKVRISGKVFTLYEGNHPQSLRKRECGNVLLPMRSTQWPAYLEISGACDAASTRIASELAAGTRRR
jgi:hypothetical protein